jgi:hypothetical protein
MKNTVVGQTGRKIPQRNKEGIKYTLCQKTYNWTQTSTL